jgi:hypothetical protein
MVNAARVCTVADNPANIRGEILRGLLTVASFSVASFDSIESRVVVFAPGERDDRNCELTNILRPPGGSHIQREFAAVGSEPNWVGAVGLS